MVLTSSEWKDLVQNVVDRDVVPVLGAGACYGIIKLGKDIAADWLRNGAEYLGADLALQLPYVAQYHRVKRQDAITIKREFIRDYIKNGSATVDDTRLLEEPHGRLASMPFRLIITTNYDDLMTRAFKAVGKKPYTLTCAWNVDDPLEKLAIIEEQSAIDPSEDEPVIFHLHGHSDDPRSLVLLEEDYELFLTKITPSRDGEAATETILPHYVQSALANSSLLFVGYSLADMTFRSVFRGILNRVNRNNTRRSVTVQYTNNLPVKQSRYSREYYDHLGINFVNQPAKEFTKELLKRYKKANGRGKS
ncbi:MAG: SIR2 family protein [Anaerolinea sp.]|nr:SIR2 family protein [Anaerolinea sp.]